MCWTFWMNKCESFLRCFLLYSPYYLLLIVHIYLFSHNMKNASQTSTWQRSSANWTPCLRGSKVSPMPVWLTVGKINDASSGSDRLQCCRHAAKREIGSLAVMCVRNNRNLSATAVWSVKKRWEKDPVHTLRAVLREAGRLAGWLADRMSRSLLQLLLSEWGLKCITMFTIPCLRASRKTVPVCGHLN